MANEAARLKAIENAKQRRASTAGVKSKRTQWFIDETVSAVNLMAGQRVKLATEFLKNKVIVNISRPVTKTVVGGRTIVTNRSKPGEFPKADTTQLMKTIFSDYESKEGSHVGYVGTPLDYGLILELHMQRPFLLRTFNEEYENIMKILNGPKL